MPAAKAMPWISGRTPLRTWQAPVQAAEPARRIPDLPSTGLRASVLDAVRRARAGVPQPWTNPARCHFAVSGSAVGWDSLRRTPPRAAYVLEAGPFTGCSGCASSARHCASICSPGLAPRPFRC